MATIDAFWHLTNLFGPALGVGLIASALAKLVWRRELAGRTWLGLAAWACAAGAIVCVAGLLFGGRDGLMLTYIAMVLASAITLWWAGFVKSR
jgi:hypothetical protein